MDYDKAAAACVKAAILTMIVEACCVFLFDLNHWWLTATVLAAYPTALLYGFIYGMFSKPEDFQVLSEEDQQELEAALDEPAEGSDDEFFFEELDDTTELSPETIGTFKDADIHEWIVVNHPAKPGGRLKCTFSHVVHDTNMFVVPTNEWFVLLMPGIVYTAAVEPEFTAAQDTPAE